MTICRKCGTSNKDNRKYCSFCNELLVADPVELALREKKLQKAAKRAEKRRKRQKRALFLLIPIGVLDLIDLVCCLDMLFLGVVDEIGGAIGGLFEEMLGNIIYLFGFPVYTSQFIEIVLRSLELLTAAGCFVAAGVMAIVMIVRMIKWHQYKKTHGGEIPAAEQQANAESGQDEGAERLTETVVPEGEIMREGVSFEALEQIEAQKDAYVMPEPVAEINCKQLYEQMVAALWQYEAADVRRLVSAMACSRLLLCDAGVVDGNEALASLYAAFGINAEVGQAPAEVSSLADLLLIKDAESGKVTHSAFAKAVYTAQYSPKNVALAGVSGIKTEQVGAAFALMNHYFRLPEEGARIYLGQPAQAAPLEGVEDGVLSVSGNLWMPMVLSEGYVPGRVQGEIAQLGVPFGLQKSKSATAGAEQVQTVAFSVSAWESAVNAAEQEYYLSEEIWKSLDELETAMLEECGTKLSNRTLRMIEKYTSVYIATGGKPMEALDNAFVSLILPAYDSEMRTLAKRSEGETLTHLLERAIGRDRLPLTMRAIRELGDIHETTQD
ncbi:MAG: zinc ribbon domain-containing protein [Clostridia bacterium]|nr:zinc ribbon domain-containing protein [Clostridia bacterium]